MSSLHDYWVRFKEKFLIDEEPNDVRAKLSFKPPKSFLEYAGIKKK